MARWPTLTPTLTLTLTLTPNPNPSPNPNPRKALLQFECRAPPPPDASGDDRKRMFLGGFATAVEAAVCFAQHMESQGATDCRV